jgi:hypothetical protein
MKLTPALHALNHLHADLGGKILDNRKDAKRLADAMKHVEAVMRMLDPSLDVRPIAVRRRKPNPFFKRGTLYRHVFDALRAAGRPLTAREVTEAILTGRNATTAQARDLQAAVKACLSWYEGKATKTVGEGTPSRWTLTDG